MIRFIGAGPGDPELITVKGKRHIEKADLIIYAGSLVNPKILNYAKPGCRILNSVGMILEEIINEMVSEEEKGNDTVRLHTGDPSLYGAVKEQMDKLKKMGFDFEVIPGVSSFSAAAAALKAEYTLPDVSQSLIITRMEGRTPVPEGQKIEDYAVHKASMAIFLSVHMIESLVEKLLKGYDKKTPVAIVYKASWPEERIIEGTLSDISDIVKKEGINKTALVLVGGFLGEKYSLSKLYDKNFSHGCREAEK